MTWKPGNETWLVYIILLKENFFQIFYKKSGLETSSRLLYFFKELSTTSIDKWYFWNKLGSYILNI